MQSFTKVSQIHGLHYGFKAAVMAFLSNILLMYLAEKTSVTHVSIEEPSDAEAIIGFGSLHHKAVSFTMFASIIFRVLSDW